MRLAHKLFAALLGLGLLPMIAAGVIGYESLTTHLQEQSRRTLGVAASGAAATIREFLDYLKGRTLDLAADWYIADHMDDPAGVAELTRYLAINRSLIRESAEVFVLHPDGRVAASSDAAAVGRDDSGTDYFRHGRERVTMTSLFRDPRTDAVTWIITAPIHSHRSGRLVGVLGNRVDPRTLSDITTGRKLTGIGVHNEVMRTGRTGEVYVVDRNGLMLTESRFLPDTVLRRRVDTMPVRRALQGGERMLGDYLDYRGEPITGASAIIPDTGWIVLAEQDFSEAAGPLRRIRSQLLWLGVGVCSAVGLLGFVFQRAILRPLNVMTAADARVVAAGPRAGLIAEHDLPGDEWRMLAMSRNRVLERLDEELRRHVAEAERQARQSELLATLADGINRPLALERILDDVVLAARELCGADGAAIVLASTPALRIGRHAAGVAADAPGPERLDLDQSAFGRAWAARTFVALEHPRQAAMCIVIDGQAHGVLGVSGRADRAFDRRDEEILRRLTAQAAIAIQNSRFRAEAETAERRKDEFLAALAHELRGPMAPVVNALQILERTAALDTAGGRLRDIIRRQVGHLARLVDDLLETARIRTGKIRLDRRLIDVCAAARGAVEALAHSGRDIAPRLTTDYRREPVVVFADSVRIEQIIRNLLDNAAKYSAGAVRLTVDERAGEAIITVEDDGAGIPADLLPRIFEPLTQADVTLSRSRGGLGLGLSVVRALVEQHGGRVSAASDGPGKGSQFMVRLPAVTAPSLPGGEGAVLPARRPLDILVVDADPDARETLALMLGVWGHRVGTATAAADAVARVTSAPFDVALVALDLPDGDGHETARRIRATAAGKSIRLLALTADGRPEDARRARETGFDAVLVTPVLPEELSRILADVAAGPPARG